MNLKAEIYFISKITKHRSHCNLLDGRHSINNFWWSFVHASIENRIDLGSIVVQQNEAWFKSGSWL